MRYLFNFVKVQVIVTIVSLPILVSWGIPISLMSLIGNFFFTPMLTIFLVTSSLIFFTELLSIPNSFLITTLTTVTSNWEFLLSFGKKTWLVGFAKSGNLLALLLILLVILLFSRILFRILSKLVMFAVICVMLVAIVHHKKPTQPGTPTKEFVPHSKKKLSVVQTPENKIELTDDGLFNRKASPKKFVAFELKPYLIKKYGSTTIEKVTLNNPTGRSFKAIHELCNTFTIKEVSIAYFDRRLSRRDWRNFYSLQERVTQDGGKFTRFSG